MKKYRINYNVGEVKYLVSHHDGVKKHKDNSEFYDITLFSNKAKMNKFCKELEKYGYKREGFY